MDKALTLIIATSLLQWLCPGSQRTPEFFLMGEEIRQVAMTEPVFTFRNLDTTILHQVYLGSDSSGTPLLFLADIQTPVCIDGLCKPMFIKIYWNLLGMYAGYRAVEGELLTKYDHEPFIEEDYLKLHHLLADPHSVLDRKQMSDLYHDEPAKQQQITYNGIEVDAVSGATKKEIKESVIEGALFSCYTAWHLVHGEAKEKIAQYLEKTFDEELMQVFLDSEYQYYQSYALKQLSSDSFRQHLPRILEIFNSAKPVTRNYILKKLPADLWQQHNHTENWYRTFPNLDINSRTTLIRQLPAAHPLAAAILAAHSAKMSRNQLKQYLKFLESRPEIVSPSILQELQRAAANPTYRYSYLITEFMK